jgi:hypothetical protein
MKIQRGYKLFEQDAAGNLYALFIDKKTIMPLGEWLKANNYPTKGFAVRPGYHIGAEVPSAPWLMSHDGTYKSQRSKQWKRIWAEVEYIADVDYTSIVAQLPKKCFTDQLPENGFYQFRETNNRLWIIADKMRITRVLTEEERKEILNQMNFDESAVFEPYRQAIAKRIKSV